MTFSRWLYIMWETHCEEIESWTGKVPTYKAKEYFQQYKWWLRREYRYRKNEGLL